MELDPTGSRATEPGTHRPGVSTPMVPGRFSTAALPQGFGQRMATLDLSYKQTAMALQTGGTGYNLCRNRSSTSWGVSPRAFRCEPRASRVSPWVHSPGV